MGLSLTLEGARGEFGSPNDPEILSETAGACGEFYFSNGLIAKPAQTGEDRFWRCAAPMGGVSRIWFEPRHPAPVPVREGRLMNVVVPEMCPRQMP
jgi:hypothetical protein